MAIKKHTRHFGQLIYMDVTERASPKHKRILARVALNVAGHCHSYPIELSEILYELGWNESQSVLGLFALHRNAHTDGAKPV